MAFRLSRDSRLIRFASTDGLTLEGRLTVADRSRSVVLCHPHPQYAGSMLTPVILTAEQAFQEAGYTTLAFNFRGVGGSEGSYGEGVAEVADVTGALEFLEETLQGTRQARAIAGYSFGSMVGGQAAARDPRVDWYLGIAPPLNLYDFTFLRSATGRIGLIAGKLDEFSDAVRLNDLADSLPKRPWVKILPTNHFFAGALDSLAGACRDAIAWAEGGPG